MKQNYCSTVSLETAYRLDCVDKKDRFQYELCSNLWCAIVEDCCSARLATELSHAICNRGLYACISSADSYAKEVLAQLDGKFDDAIASTQQNPAVSNLLVDIWSRIVTEACEYSPRLESVSYVFHDEADVATAAACQIVLRFPKRFTKTDPDVSGAVQKFIQVHKETKRFGNSWWRWPGPTIMEHLRRNLREILIPAEDELYEAGVFIYDHLPGTFSAGSLYYNQLDYKWEPKLCFDAVSKGNTIREARALVSKYHKGESLGNLKGTPFEKMTIGQIEKLAHQQLPKIPEWKRLSKKTGKLLAAKWGSLACDSDYLYTYHDLYGTIPNVRPTRMPIRSTPDKYAFDFVNAPAYRKRDVYIMAVPKDYETSRMIAPETTYLNVQASRVRRLLLWLTTATGAIKQMPPEDQSFNRERARLGSIGYPEGNPYCTLDLSHASDSISRDLFFALCPPELKRVIRDALSDYMVIGNELVETKMLFTSGSVIGPMLQSCLFLAILRTAADLAGEERDVSCYNDDLICRHSLVPTVIELLSSCGLTVNQKKSFWTGSFRESCGGEYLCGCDVTGVYWPRKAIADVSSCHAPLNSAQTTAIQQLVALQHKLWGYPTACRILEEVVCQVFPDFTYSPVATDCDDLWAAWMDVFTSMKSWHYHIMPQKLTYKVSTPGQNKPKVSTEPPKSKSENKTKGKETSKPDGKGKKQPDPKGKSTPTQQKPKVSNSGQQQAKDPLSKYLGIGTELAYYYAYISFLRNGPKYADDLARLLHVTEDCRVSPLEYTESKWIKQKPVVRDKW